MLRKNTSLPVFSKKESDVTGVEKKLSAASLVDRVAKLNHEEWMSWSKKLAAEKNVPVAKKKEWEKLWVDYDKLSQVEKKKDIDWAKKYIELVKSAKDDDEDRGVKTNYIIANGEKIELEPFLKKYRATGMIRIQDKDYSHIPKKYLAHFNLQHCEHRVGKLYLLPRIIKSGFYRPDGTQQLPNLDFNNCLIAKCVAVREKVSYSELSEDDFEYSMTNIRNKSELRDAIVFRYSKSFPNHSKKQLIDMGVSVTTLEILGKIKTQSLNEGEVKKCFIDSLDLSKTEANRDGFGRGMLELGKNKNVVALTADLTGSVKLTEFKDKYPARFFQFGISEQNMLSAAAGMTLIGKVPFVTSFAAFNPGRNWDQLRVSVCYQNSNVKIFGSHAGLTTGADGATHQALEDIAITRVLPNLSVIVPCDSEEMRKAVLASARVKGPVYLRGSRAKTLNITNKQSKFEIGKANVLDRGDDVTIVACGVCVQFALMAKKELLRFGIDASVVNCHTIKPFDSKTVLSLAKRTGAVVTVEEHQRAGGLGSVVCEFLAQNFPVPVEVIGTDDTFGESGEDYELLEKYNISVREIVRRAKRVVKRKG